MPDKSVIIGDMQAILPMIVLWVTASVIALGDVSLWKRGNKAINPLLAIVGVLVAFKFLVNTPRVASGATAFAKSLAIDPLGQISGIALLVTAVLSILLAWTYLKNRGLDHAEYYVLLLLSLTGAMMMASANDLIVLFLGLEILSFGLYVMAGFARTEERSEEASVKYFLLGAFGSAFLLYGIALVYGATQSTNLEQIRATLSSSSGAPGPMLLAGIGLLIVGLGFKAAIVPFHQWTPDVYEGAPTAATAYMAGAAKIGAFAAMLRVFGALTPVAASWLPAIQILAIVTMVFGNLLAVTQTNVKRLLAYSSIAHAGYLLVAIAALPSETVNGIASNAPDLAVGGALFYLFAYVFMTLGAFGVLVYLSSKGRDVQHVNDLRGLAKREPAAAYAMMFFMLSLGGIPPTMGFMGKWQIFYAAVTGQQIMLAIVMALTSAMAVYYYLRVVWVMCFEETTEAAAPEPVARTGAMAAIMLAAAATIVFGIAPNLLNAITGMGP